MALLAWLKSARNDGSISLNGLAPLIHVKMGIRNACICRALSRKDI